MSAILAIGNNLIAVGAQFLNQPVVKEGIKNGISLATFAFGIAGAYDLYRELSGRKISIVDDADVDSQWLKVANKVILAAKIGLVLSGMVSRPGVFIISQLTHLVASKHQLETVFGPNTIFALNPWHPRHVTSIVAVALTMPMIALYAYKGFNWANKKVIPLSTSTTSTGGKNAITTWLTDAKICLMAFLTTITSRPVLHQGNHLVRWLLRV